MPTSPVTYLTGVSTPDTRAAHRPDLGLLATPDSGVVAQREDYPAWAADNGCFTKGDRFDVAKWLRWLEANADGASSCLFAVLPDVVGDARATFARSLPYVDEVRAMGYPVAIAAQNGLAGERIPWDAIDVLFLGGDDAFKLGPTAKAATRAAKRLGKPVHMGRVNSLKRLRIAHAFGCDTADGTFLKYGRKGENWPRLERMLDTLALEHAEAGARCRALFS